MNKNNRIPEDRARKAMDNRKKIRTTLYFVKTHQFVLVVGKKPLRILQFLQIGGTLKVKIDAVWHIFHKMFHHG